MNRLKLICLHLFSNSLHITKDRNGVSWCLLSYVFFTISSLVLVSIEKIHVHQTLFSVFHYIFKHLKARQKYSAVRRIFNSLLSSQFLEMWSTPSFVFALLVKAQSTN